MIIVLDLYPKELNINGDIGNVMALAKRAEWRGMPLTVVNHEPGDALPSVAHLVHIGSGTIAAQELVRADLAAHSELLRSWADAGVPFLAIAGGWQLLGASLTDLAGVTTAGVGVFPTTARLTNDRVVREVWTPDVAGFENHGAVTSGVPAGQKAVVEHGASVATNLHGPFLPMNPSWADRLLGRAAVRAGVPLGELDDRTIRADEYAAKSRDAIRKRLRL